MSSDTFEMGPLQTKWVEELESGKHDQTIGVLACSEGMCCLGLAAEHVLNLSGEVITPDDGDWSFYAEKYTIGDVTWIKAFHAELGELAAFARLGLLSSSGHYDQLALPNDHLFRNHADLASANDGGKSFAEIAAFIREYPHLIFTEPK